MINHYYETIEGWFDWPDLYTSVARRVPLDGKIVEVGCWAGKSLCYLLVELVNFQKNAQVYAVDHWKGSVDTDWMIADATNRSIKNICMANCQRSTYPYTTFVEKPSVEAAKGFADHSIWFCFIDASHDPNSVYNDLVAWSPKIAHNGWLAGHDWYYVNTTVLKVFPQATPVSSDCWEVHFDR